MTCEMNFAPEVQSAYKITKGNAIGILVEQNCTSEDNTSNKMQRNVVNIGGTLGQGCCTEAMSHRVSQDCVTSFGLNAAKV